MKNIFVTKTFLPQIEKYQSYLNRIWDNNQLTNQGPLLGELELKLKNYLKVDNFHFVTNGTLALQLALNALDITEGEVITTPFSYVATVSSILWERCKPVFVDIEPGSFCIDPNKIEIAITKYTKAIIAVHVFGLPCALEKIGRIANEYNLKVIYDGAHAFGVTYKGKSLLSYGDISTCSFHATKLFHTIEGGCVIAKDKGVSAKLELIKRFGHNFDNHYCLGINAKASEFQAAMGLCNFEEIENIIKERKLIFELYDDLLKIDLQHPIFNNDFEYNYGYYPVVFKSEEETSTVIKSLKNENIYPRRYFYPSLNTLSYLKQFQSCPISEDISLRILCLPLYVGLEIEVVEKISKIINGCCDV
jgi:dTDP-4-amino-4,6-dideoxygalactose transaminase